MTPLKRLKAFGVPITWATLHVGLSGIPSAHSGLLRVVSSDEAAEAARQLEVDGGSPPAPLTADAYDEAGLLAVLRDRAGDAYNHDTELHKWRIALLGETMERPAPDLLNRCLAIMEFWSEMGWPPSTPALIREGGEPLKRAFQTAEGLGELVKRHEEWIEREVAALRSRSDPTLPSAERLP